MAFMHEINTIETFYGPIGQQIFKKAKEIRLLICDVDGVMSDGMIYINNHGEEIKAFNVHDGYGIRCLLKKGIEVAIITGSNVSKALEYRCNSLDIKYLYQEQSDKNLALKSILNKLKLNAQQVAYIGDDLIDASIMNQVGLSVSVADAHPVLRHKANYVTNKIGGHGAIREICDLILLSQGKFNYF